MLSGNPKSLSFSTDNGEGHFWSLKRAIAGTKNENELPWYIGNLTRQNKLATKKFKKQKLNLYKYFYKKKLSTCT